ERASGRVGLGDADGAGGQADDDAGLPLDGAAEAAVGDALRLAALVGEVEDVGVEGADLRAVRRVDVAARRAAAPALERDERVTGDLVGEAGAALAQDAAVPVEEDLAGDLQRLGEGPLDVDEAGGRPAVRHRLVLQRALPALVADGAVERV